LEAHRIAWNSVVLEMKPLRFSPLFGPVIGEV